MMEEYVSKNGLIKFLDNLRQPKKPVHPAWLTKGFKYITIDEAIKVVSERPSADVVEREKVDKAIKEMQSIPLYAEYTRGGIRQMCVDILKRNIGK